MPRTSAMSSELTPVVLGDASFQERYEVGTVSAVDPDLVRPLFSSEFVAWMNSLAMGEKAEDVTRFELRAGTLCVSNRSKLKTAQQLDAFCGKAARIASQVERATAFDPR